MLRFHLQICLPSLELEWHGALFSNVLPVLRIFVIDINCLDLKYLISAEMWTTWPPDFFVSDPVKAGCYPRCLALSTGQSNVCGPAVADILWLTLRSTLALLPTFYLSEFSEVWLLNMLFDD